MKTNTITPDSFESTYALIVRSDERERSIAEVVIYTLLTLSAVFSIWQFTLQPITVPTNLVQTSSANAVTQRV